MNKRTKGESLFPMWLFFVYLGVLLLMSGIHSGLLLGAGQWGWGGLLRTLSPILYGAAVAGGLTVFTRYRIRITYEEPMLRLADATRKVAKGDFSVYLAPIHTPDKTDYLDQMFLDFNQMVEELGSIETLKTDFFSGVSHEFKSPLAVISGSADLLQKSPALTDRDRKEVDSIRDATRRLADLIQNMLKLNKLEKQTIPPRCSTSAPRFAAAPSRLRTSGRKRTWILRQTWRTAPTSMQTRGSPSWCGTISSPTPSSSPRPAGPSPSPKRRWTTGWKCRCGTPAAA